MNKKYYLFIPIALLVLFSSCANLRIEKRHYNKGFYVDFTNDRKSEATVATSNETQIVAVENSSPSESQVATTTGEDNTVTRVNTQVAPTTSVGVAEVVTEQTSSNKPGSWKNVDQQKDATRVVKNAPAAEPATGGDTNLILLFILALLIPPLAVYLKQGLTTMFWIDLICAIFGCGFLFSPFIGGLFLVAVIIAILVVFDVI